MAGFGVECDAKAIAPAAFARITSTRRLDQELAHGARCDPLEMEARSSCKIRRGRELDPSLVHESGGAQRGAGIAAANGGGETAQLLVGHAEEIIELLPFLGSACHRVVLGQLDCAAFTLKRCESNTNHRRTRRRATYAHGLS